MTEVPYPRLEEVVSDALFPEVDADLRRGCHIERDETERYAFLLDAQGHLEPFYQRYGCELVHSSDGYFYLIPTGDRMGRRHLGVGEMLVGQALALLYLDPATLPSGRRVSREQLTAQMVGLVGEQNLVQALNPRRRGKYDERVAQETVRSEIGTALRGLAGLGFIELLDGAGVRLRSPLLRFAEPVRGLEDPAEALARLVALGRAAIARSEPEPAEEEGEEA